MHIFIKKINKYILKKKPKNNSDIQIILKIVEIFNAKETLNDSLLMELTADDYVLFKSVFITSIDIE